MVHSYFFLAVAITVLLAAKPTHALGCYTSGLTFGQVSSSHNLIAEARQRACRKFGGKTYPQGGHDSLCVPFTATGNRIDFYVRNNAGTTQFLSYNDCVAALTIEMNACSRGSEQNHGQFFYRDDPNAGHCWRLESDVTPFQTQNGQATPPKLAGPLRSSEWKSVR
jgi:hypothetical protein